MSEALALAGQFGPLGILVAYLMWEKDRHDKRWSEVEKARIEQDKARTEADRSMAVALTALTTVIQARP